MEALVSFFKGIGDFIVTIADFVISLFQDLIYVIGIIGQVVVAIPSYFSWVPSTYQVLLISLISIVVIYKILGREG